LDNQKSNIVDNYNLVDCLTPIIVLLWPKTSCLVSS